MAELTPVSWAVLIRRLRELGFDGPFRGSKHPYMVKDDLVLTVPNPHRVALLARILKQAKVSRSDWQRKK